MKKFKQLALIALVTVPVLTACGNKDILGTTYTFNYATVKLPDGTLVEGKVEAWARESILNKPTPPSVTSENKKDSIWIM